MAHIANERESQSKLYRASTVAMIRLFVDWNKVHTFVRCIFLSQWYLHVFSIIFFCNQIYHCRGSIAGQKSDVSLQTRSRKKNTNKINSLHSHCIRKRYLLVSSTYIFSTRMLGNLPFASGIPGIAVIRYRNVVTSACLFHMFRAKSKRRRLIKLENWVVQASTILDRHTTCRIAVSYRTL